MRSVSVRLADLERVTIPIGFEGENDYTHVHIDCKKVFDEDNSFVPTLALVAPSGEKYPGIVTRDGDIVTWVVSASDLTKRGAGELQLAFTKDNVIGKTYVARTRVERSITPDGEVPSVIENFIIEAGQIVNGIPQAIEDAIDDVMDDITAEAETLQPGSSASASFDPETKTFEFGIPTGAKGDPGDPGEPGEDGYSPSASVSKNGKVATISITDKNGTTTATISDGEDGTDGDDGYSPVATVSKSGHTATISITDKNGTTTASVSDGEDADPSELIDDTTPALNKTFSSNKLDNELGDLKSAINVLKPAATASDVGKFLKVKTVADGKPTAFEYGEGGGSGAVDDVQVNGTSIVNQGVANIPIADYGQPGAFNTESGMGFGYDTVGGVKTYKVSQATSEQIKTGSNAYRPIAPQKQHEAVFYGLAKASGEDMALSANPVGTYTSEAKAAIRDMLGVPGDVQVDGTSVVNNGVANVPMASTDNLGVVKIGSNMQISSNGVINFRSVGASEVKAGTTYQRALTPERQHASAFYGLAKAAGDSTQAESSNAVGNYTEDAKSSISEMLNGAVSVSGTTPSITAKAGVRYICGEVSTLTIVVPASGCIDVTFESGSTPTVLTVTTPTGMTMKWANGFDPTALEANTTYEINIMDGCLGVAGSWT